MYLLCSAPRTGSTLLTQALTATGIAGLPNEYFSSNGNQEALWKFKLDIKPADDYLTRIAEFATTPNGVLGLKLHLHQCSALVEKLTQEHRMPAFRQKQVFNRNIASLRPKLPVTLHVESGNMPFWAEKLPALLRERFGEPKYLWLRRDNLVAQAISFYRAVKSDEWFGIGEQRPYEGEVDLKELSEYVTFCRECDEGWRELFESQSIRPYEISYEELVKTYDLAVRCVIDFLEISDPYIISSAVLRKQGDEWSKRVEAQYRAEDNGCFHPVGR
jgi:trehalose 2-sulfotransferase